MPVRVVASVLPASFNFNLGRFIITVVVVVVIVLVIPNHCHCLQASNRALVVFLSLDSCCME
jgi:hypothetical protein